MSTDVTAALMKLMDHPGAVGEVFNIGSNQEVTIRALAERVRTLAGSPSDIVCVPYEQAYGEGFRRHAAPGARYQQDRSLDRLSPESLARSDPGKRDRVFPGLAVKRLCGEQAAGRENIRKILADDDRRFVPGDGCISRPSGTGCFLSWCLLHQLPVRIARDRTTEIAESRRFQDRRSGFSSPSCWRA